LREHRYDPSLGLVVDEHEYVHQHVQHDHLDNLIDHDSYRTNHAGKRDDDLDWKLSGGHDGERKYHDECGGGNEHDAPFDPAATEDDQERREGRDARRDRNGAFRSAQTETALHRTAG